MVFSMTGDGLRAFRSKNRGRCSVKLAVIGLSLILALCYCMIFSSPYLYKVVDGTNHIHKDYFWNTGVRYSTHQPSDDVTIVTGYINIGEFCKGSCNNVRKVAHYDEWMKNYGKLENPVIAFFDTEVFARSFKSIRGDLPTLVQIVDCTDLWSFSNIKRIKHIFENVSGMLYKKHYPNTVVPEYACAVSAKYEFMSHTLRENPFNTRYMAWIDIGYFRGQEKDNFGIWLPEGYDSEKVALSAVYSRLKDISAEVIFRNNRDWLASNLWIANTTVMRKWVDNFQRTVETLLESQLMGADQQVLYSMLNWTNHTVDVQTFKQPAGQGGDPWFYISRLCRDSWKRKQAKT